MTYIQGSALTRVKTFVSAPANPRDSESKHTHRALERLRSSSMFGSLSFLCSMLPRQRAARPSTAPLTLSGTLYMEGMVSRLEFVLRAQACSKHFSTGAAKGCGQEACSGCGLSSQSQQKKGKKLGTLRLVQGWIIV